MCGCVYTCTYIYILFNLKTDLKLVDNNQETSILANDKYY